MPDEALIQKMEDIISEIIRLGGQNERTSIVSNLTVTDANPAGLAGFITVSDDRDGDNILAKKVPSVIYTTNDLVNVIFQKGGEAIAFQQGSQSGNAAIWEVVSGTSTDIFYNKGDVGIGKSVAPDATLEILDTATQLRLTYEEDTKYTTFTVDTSHHLSINPSSTGQIKLDATVTVIDEIQHEGDATTKIGFTTSIITNTVGGIEILTLTNAAQDLIEIGDVAGTGDVDINFNNGQAFLRGSDGYVGIGTIAPLSELDVAGIITLSGGTGNIERDVDNLAVRINAATSNANGASLAFFGRDHVSVPGDLFLNHGGYDAVGGLWIRHLDTSGSFTTQVYVSITGEVGIGVGSSPQGQLHAYDAISGFLIWEYDGLDATVRTIVPNGTGDCLYRLHAAYVLRDSAAAVASGTTDVSNGASVNLTVGTNTVRLRVNADGSTDVARTAGTDTIKVALTLRWL